MIPLTSEMGGVVEDSAAPVHDEDAATAAKPFPPWRAGWWR